jgi:[protein-PII] uridylyltransferase
LSQDTDLARTLRSDLAGLDGAYPRGLHGLESARRRADIFDGALRALFERAGSPEGVAVAALGGYGRRRQLPRSDLDVLLLHEQPDAELVREFAEQLLYPLWDAGIEVGHAVRTPEECLSVAKERLDALTSLLEARLVAGSEDLLARSLVPIADLARFDTNAFVESLRTARDARAERYGSACHLLEPDLKEAIGGLRDVASLGWLECSIGTNLERAELITERDRHAVHEAEEFLVRARSALHLETARRTDRLTTDLQSGVAAAMSFRDEDRLSAIDGLMRGVFEHAREVDFVVSCAFGRAEGSQAESAPVDAGSPAAVLHALIPVAGAGMPASARLVDSLAKAKIPEPLEWTDQVRDSFMTILDAPGSTVALETLDRVGLLTRFLHSWEEVRCRPQRDPYHRLTVDAHLTQTVANMRASLDDDHMDDSVQVEASRQVSDRDALLLGALLHDVGKTGRGRHVPEGVRVAEGELVRMRVPDATRDLAVFLVREHLLLPDTATRRDLGDENQIIDVAARVETPERLAALYLLAKADAVATGPAAWTPWRSALIRELVAKVQRVFERGEMGQQLAEQLTDRIERLRELLAGQPEEAVDRFVLGMPRGYFLAIEPEQAARHFALVTPLLSTTEIRTLVEPGNRPGAHQLLVVATDRPGLLSQIAGALTLSGLSILTAQVFTTDEGAAVDLFEVEGAFEPEIERGRWRSFEKDLRASIEGLTALEPLIEEKRHRYSPPMDSPITVSVDNEASDFWTVVEVGGPDRIGFLYEVTRALADLRLDVHLAKVATYEGRVIDAFYVRDALGSKVTDPAQTAEIETFVLERLGR